MSPSPDVNNQLSVLPVRPGNRPDHDFPTTNREKFDNAVEKYLVKEVSQVVFQKKDTMTFHVEDAKNISKDVVKSYMHDMLENNVKLKENFVTRTYSAISGVNTCLYENAVYLRDHNAYHYRNISVSEDYCRQKHVIDLAGKSNKALEFANIAWKANIETPKEMLFDIHGQYPKDPYWYSAFEEGMFHVYEQVHNTTEVVDFAMDPVAKIADVIDRDIITPYFVEPSAYFIDPVIDHGIDTGNAILSSAVSHSQSIFMPRSVVHVATLSNDFSSIVEKPFLDPRFGRESRYFDDPLYTGPLYLKNRSMNALDFEHHVRDHHRSEDQLRNLFDISENRHSSISPNSFGSDFNIESFENNDKFCPFDENLHDNGDRVTLENWRNEVNQYMVQIGNVANQVNRGVHLVNSIRDISHSHHKGRDIGLLTLQEVSNTKAFTNLAGSNVSNGVQIFNELVHKHHKIKPADVINATVRSAFGINLDNARKLIHNLKHHESTRKAFRDTLRDVAALLSPEYSLLKSLYEARKSVKQLVHSVVHKDKMLERHGISIHMHDKLSIRVSVKHGVKETHVVSMDCELLNIHNETVRRKHSSQAESELLQKFEETFNKKIFEITGIPRLFFDETKNKNTTRIGQMRQAEFSKVMTDYWKRLHHFDERENQILENYYESEAHAIQRIKNDLTLERQSFYNKHMNENILQFTTNLCEELYHGKISVSDIFYDKAKPKSSIPVDVDAKAKEIRAKENELNKAAYDTIIKKYKTSLDSKLSEINTFESSQEAAYLNNAAQYQRYRMVANMNYEMMCTEDISASAMVSCVGSSLSTTFITSLVYLDYEIVAARNGNILKKKTIDLGRTMCQQYLTNTITKHAVATTGLMVDNLSNDVLMTYIAPNIGFIAGNAVSTLMCYGSGQLRNKSKLDCVKTVTMNAMVVNVNPVNKWMLTNVPVWKTAVAKVTTYAASLVPAFCKTALMTTIGSFISPWIAPFALVGLTRLFGSMFSSSSEKKGNASNLLTNGEENSYENHENSMQLATNRHRRENSVDPFSSVVIITSRVKIDYTSSF